MMLPGSDEWCCPNSGAVDMCVYGFLLPGFNWQKNCHSVGCYRYFLDRIEKERELKKVKEAVEKREAPQQKPSDCGKCQTYLNGRCKSCYDAGLYCLDGKCVTSEEYSQLSRNKIRSFVEAQEKRKMAEERAEHQRAQERFNIKRALERSYPEIQEQFNERNRRIEERQRVQNEINELKRQERERELSRQQEYQRRQREQAERNRNHSPTQSGNVWAGVSAGMRQQAEKLKAEFDNWNRNFPNRKKEYPKWIQRFFGRGI